MANLIVQKFLEFRQSIIAKFSYTKDALMNLIDATAGRQYGESVVKISLNSLFLRQYSSISYGITNLFRKQSKGPTSDSERKKGKLELTQIFAKQCPLAKKRSFTLLGIDCVPHERLFANKLEERTMIYSPNKAGQTPVTIGHQYSLIAYLPEKEQTNGQTWLVPLSIERIKPNELGTDIGINQIKTILQETELGEKLCVNVNDSAYSCGSYIKQSQSIHNLIQIARLRSNRVFYLPAAKVEHPKRGRPARYGVQVHVKNMSMPNSQVILQRKTKRGRVIDVKIERFCDLFIKGQEQCDAVDVVRVTVCNEWGQPLYARPLLLVVVGDRRLDLSLEDIFDAYVQRYDLEHFFRFSKQRLLLTSFQTSHVQHEENWQWICLIAYLMLYMTRQMAKLHLYHWEKHKEQSLSTESSPSYVQRDYVRIIKELGGTTVIPKRRGKSLGRRKGQIMPKRPIQLVIKKGKKITKSKKKMKKVA